MTASSPPRERVLSAGRLGHEDAAVFEMFVVPRYLALFGEPLVEMLAAAEDARVCHLSCRTGYPDRALLERLPNAHVHGCDTSAYAIELARAKAAALGPSLRVEREAGDARESEGSVVFDYHVADGYPLDFPDSAFSHVFSVHPLAGPSQRKALLEEMARIVAPFGQALLAMPLRGSFGEVADLLRECALKYELVQLTNAVDAAMQLRPTEEMLEQELEAAGFEYVEIEAQQRTLRFPSGRAFFDDPVTRLMVMSEFRAGGVVETTVRGVEPFAYVRDAIDKYWSAGTFSMTVNVGIVSGRRAEVAAPDGSERE